MALIAVHLSHSGDDSVLWSNRYIISLFPHLHTPFSPSLINLMVSVDIKHHVYLLSDNQKRRKNPTMYTYFPNLWQDVSDWHMKMALMTWTENRPSGCLPGVVIRLSPLLQRIVPRSVAGLFPLLWRTAFILHALERFLECVMYFKQHRALR